MIIPGLWSALVGFACGSIPFGFVAGRLSGLDIRRHGSGNIGFTNVQRTIGWPWAIPVLLLDIVKGLIPTALAGSLGLLPPLVGIGAVLGHVFCPWLGFNGGKGVATALGVAAFVCPRSFLAAFGAFLLVLAVTGFISASSLTMAVILPLVTAVLYRNNPGLLTFAVGITLVIAIRHAANIRRLSAGTEPRLGLWLKLFRRT